MAILAEPNHDEPRKRVGVIVASDSSSGTAPGQGVAYGQHGAGGAQLDPGQQRMLAALEDVFPVRFDPGPIDLSALDGVLVLGSPSLGGTRTTLPRLVLPSGVGARETAAHETAAHETAARETAARGAGSNISGAAGETAPVVLSDGSSLAQPLRGRAIPESAIADGVPLAPVGGSVLARVQDRPVWWQVGDATAPLDVSAYPLAGLREGESLRDHLQVGRFMGLLPLVHFIGRVLGAEGWSPPPLRASFVIDDPNLHWPSYGFLKYGELAAHAARHGYHVALATVPIDGWLTDPRVAALLAGNASALSLVMHGNDHVAHELGRLSTDAEAQSAIAQALRRVAALERRSGVKVDRVMTPPHGACSEAALRAMFRLGVEAVSVAPVYPWRIGRPAATPLANWQPAEMVAGGLPVLPRYQLGAPREELALRAMLGQPLILYGHHEDFAEGLDVLAQAASEIDGLGDVQWGPLGQIARGSYATRRLGETLHVRMHARRIAVEVPAGVRALRVLIDEPFGGAAGHRLSHAGGSVDVAFGDGVGVSEPIAVMEPARPTRIDLTLLADRPLRPSEVPAPGVRLWPWLRRALAEGNDRVQALR
jgi:hypothetical protein